MLKALTKKKDMGGPVMAAKSDCDPKGAYNYHLCKLSQLKGQ
jgi:hypothetical protein